MNSSTALYTITISLLILLIGCSVSKDPLRKKIKMQQKGIVKDDSSYIYQLPYEPGKSRFLVQGYYSRYSHKNRAALDFKMKKGSTICAVRNGVVVRVKEDGKKGGWKKKYRPEGNYIIIQHEDSSRSGFWHLKYNGALVKAGDSVYRGQAIALSGKTGYALFPHLHFLVWKHRPAGGWKQVPTRFQTATGIRYLRPFRFYRNDNQSK